MAETTQIQWCDHTFNPWRGCVKVSPGCQHCYAEQLSKRNPKVLGEWGPDGVRVIAGESYWRQPVKWNAEAKASGLRRRVFCASLADVFEDRPELIAPRQRLFALIGRTPQLDWLLLTKRPENVRRFGLEQQLWQPRDGLPPNVWMGTSVEDQLRLRRCYDLAEVRAAVRVLCCEPLLGALDFTDGPLDPHSTMGQWSLLAGIDWVIVGGESGPGARPCDLSWIRSIVQQCAEEGVACFVKQLGSNFRGLCHNGVDRDRIAQALGSRYRLMDAKGGDPHEWPVDLRIRQYPTARQQS